MWFQNLKAPLKRNEQLLPESQAKQATGIKGKLNLGQPHACSGCGESNQKRNIFSGLQIVLFLFSLSFLFRSKRASFNHPEGEKKQKHFHLHFPDYFSELMEKLYVQSFFPPPSPPLVFHHFFTCLHLPSLSKLLRQFPIYKAITSPPSRTWFLEQAALSH